MYVLVPELEPTGSSLLSLRSAILAIALCMLPNILYAMFYVACYCSMPRTVCDTAQTLSLFHTPSAPNMSCYSLPILRGSIWNCIG